MDKNKEKLLREQNNRFISFEELIKIYVELEDRLKALEEKFSKKDSENNQNFHRWKLSETTKKEKYH